MLWEPQWEQQEKQMTQVEMSTGPHRAQSCSLHQPRAWKGEQGASALEQRNTAVLGLEKELQEHAKSIGCFKSNIQKLQWGRGFHLFNLLASTDMPLKLYGLICK